MVQMERRERGISWEALGGLEATGRTDASGRIYVQNVSHRSLQTWDTAPGRGDNDCLWAWVTKW